ncbi:MAG: hypothetical protein KatS3mg042_0261 [Rhodothermaceae bacterium]|nr:MAG: hypothetical protein KatS3mg042_0261 [Rhodothermaceae bacterium]
MYLSRLELHGFKSFATRTVVDFSPGITVVVGPNGCGKSNIVDAVRWVIGEQRARILRSSKMENVIFNGTAKRRPLGMAEVQLTIENTRGVLPTEYTEVTIGRRLYRSGESEYLLNGVPCRLRDITDLFMDTGMGAGAYSVIELKMIDDILSDNAQDRRHLFEEAAGITKYKLRRAQTLRKLEGTQVDLTRLRDLVGELEKRVQGLRRQANKAERYRTQEARLHALELALAQAEYDRLQEQARHLTAERQRLRDRLEAHQARLARAEADLEALRTRHIEREQVLVARQAALQEHLDALRQLEAERRLEEQRLETTRRDLERLQREQDEAGRRRDTLARTRAKLEAELAAAEPVLREAEARLEAARQARQAAEADAEAARRHRDAARREEQQAAAAHADLRRRLDRLTARRDWLRQEIATLEAREAELAREAADHDERVRDAARRQAEAEAAVAEAREALARAEALHADRSAALEKALEARRQAERRRDAAAAEVHLLDSLLSTHDDLDAPARFLAERPAWSRGAVQTVADLLACDEGYRPALAAALGPLAACLVVDTVAEAHAARALLREHGQGAATFLIRERLRPVEPLSAPEGARPLAAVVRAARGHEGLARTLLFDTFLVDDLATAERLAGEAAAPARFFTLEGEGVDARGWLQAGSGGRAAWRRPDASDAANSARPPRLPSNAVRPNGTAAVEAVAAARQALEAVPLAGARHGAGRRPSGP